MTWEQEMKHQRWEAFEEGKAEGRAEGLSMGRSEGARQNAIENAKSALSLGLSIEQVSRITKLSEKEIRAEISVVQSEN